MNTIPESVDIVRISENVISEWHKRESENISPEDAFAPAAPDGDDEIIAGVRALSIINTTLWHEEDKARDPDSGDSIIAGVKRCIDRLNASRTGTVEEIDSLIFSRLKLDDRAPLATETPGCVIDRLTILCLKKYHMNEEARREGTSEEHRHVCSEKLDVIIQQIGDLCLAYDTLLKEAAEGKRRFKMYRQFKMYNDPSLNPVLYGRKNKQSPAP